MQHLFRGKIHI